MNPYLAGFFLGLVTLATIFITGRGLVQAAPQSIVSQQLMLWLHQTPGTLLLWQLRWRREGTAREVLAVFEVAGVLIGAFISGLTTNRLRIVTESGPRVHRGVR